MKKTTAELQSILAPYYGSDQVYHHAIFKKFFYTEGVRAFFQNAGEHGAYWLADYLATDVMQVIKKNPKCNQFCAILVEVSEENTCDIKLDDGDHNIVHTWGIDYTDLQPGTWKFYMALGPYDETGHILMLPNEY